MGMESTIAAYEKASDWVDALNVYLDDNIHAVQLFLKEHIPEIKVVYPESTYLIWLDVSDLNMAMDELQHRLINIGKVAIMDGQTYGGNGQHF